ncbi:MAG: PilZ domain-containing protein [Methylocystis sp.]|nr:PilZ domain-containing protein [Methylocystis sp.]
MSPDYIAVHAGRAPEIAEKVVLLLDEFGRFDGKVVLCFRTGFTMNFEAEGRRRERVATQLAWLSRRHTLEGAAQLRRHERIVPFRSDSTIAAGDEVFPCQIKNMSRGGALLATPGKARNGAKLTIGRNTRAEVVRQTEDGFAVVFMRLLPLETFDWHLEL